VITQRAVAPAERAFPPRDAGELVVRFRSRTLGEVVGVSPLRVEAERELGDGHVGVRCVTTTTVADDDRKMESIVSRDHRTRDVAPERESATSVGAAVVQRAVRLIDRTEAPAGSRLEIADGAGLVAAARVQITGGVGVAPVRVLAEQADRR
jgi:two-component sensor histidine kinase